MRTTTRNEAAERLRKVIFDLPECVSAYQRDQLNVYLSGALHEQVERIRTAWQSAHADWGMSDSSGRWDALVRAILDEEAAR